jgi:Protein of unknown function (DUF2380)
MRVSLKIATALLLGMFVSGAHAAQPKVAVFDFELLDTSLEGATYGPRPDQQARLAQTAKQLREELAESGRVLVVDTAPVAAEASAADLPICDGCEAALARRVDADFAVTGWVQKVSNLILNMNIMARDARSGRVISVKGVDMRGNTDETWSRAIDWPVRYDLPAPSGEGVFR